MSSSSKPLAPFKVLLSGTPENKSHIVSLLQPIRTYGVDFYSHSIGDCRFQIWNLADQERFRTMQSSYYKSANAVIIFSENVEDFLRLFNRILETLDLDSNCAIGVVTGNGIVEQNAADFGLFCIKPPVNDLNEFLKTMSKPEYQKRIIHWKDDRLTGEYYRIISQAFLEGCSQLNDTIDHMNIAELVVQYAMPLFMTFNRVYITQAQMDERYRALMHESSLSEDPLFHIQLYLFYKHSQKMDFANAHLALAKEYILNVENQLVTEEHFQRIFNLLQKEGNEDVNMQSLVESFLRPRNPNVEINVGAMLQDLRRPDRHQFFPSQPRQQAPEEFPHQLRQRAPEEQEPQEQKAAILRSDEHRPGYLR